MKEPRLGEHGKWVKSQKDLADALGVSRQDINRHNVPGCPPKNADGWYNVEQWAEWLIARMPLKGKRLATALEMDDDEDADGQPRRKSDQARYEKARADKVEKEVARLEIIIEQLRGELADARALTNIMGEEFGRVKSDAYQRAREVATEQEGKDASDIGNAICTGILDKLFEGVIDGIRDTIKQCQRLGAGESV